MIFVQLAKWRRATLVSGGLVIFLLVWLLLPILPDLTTPGDSYFPVGSSFETSPASTSAPPTLVPGETNQDFMVRLLKERLMPHVKSFPPPPGKKYHTCIVLILRNELHIVEFLVRNILAGVQHFYIVDDDRVKDNRDMDMKPIFAPFNEFGFLTVLESDLPGNQSMNDPNKYRYMRKLGAIAFNECKWASVTDSDEIWYPLDPRHAAQIVRTHRNESSQKPVEDDTSGISHLVPLLERLDNETGFTTAQFKWPWTEPDPEMRIMRGKRTLLEDYPRGCHYRRNTKVWAHVDRIEGLADHSYRMKKNYKAVTFGDHQHMLLIHYQFKSVEEYLLKIEQAFTEWLRSLHYGRRKCNALTPNSAFDQSIARGQPHKIQYGDLYTNIVTSIVSSWPIPVGSSFLGSPDSLAIGMYGTVHWELYMFFKWAVASKYEWDDQAYRTVNNWQITEKYDDGLQHFFYTGFFDGYRACFKAPDGKTVCPRTGKKPAPPGSPPSK